LPELRRRFRATPDSADKGVASGLSLEKRPASEKRMHLSYSHEDIAAHSARIRSIPPERR